MEKVKFIIKKDGSLTVETEGFKGSACLEATEEIINTLGRVSSTEKTAEYYKDDNDREAWITKNN
jgi:hypothetical protein